MNEIFTDDLIGAPWEIGGRGPSYDCGGLVCEVLERLGFSAPHIPTGHERDPYAAVNTFGDAWDRIGPSPLAACLLGDVIVTDPRQNGRSVHLSIVVGERPRRVLTVVERGGVTRAPQISEAETVGAYRLRDKVVTR